MKKVKTGQKGHKARKKEQNREKQNKNKNNSTLRFSFFGGLTLNANTGFSARRSTKQDKVVPRFGGFKS